MPEPNLSLSIEEIGRIIGFLGYGRLSAPVWFIGIEEGLGRANSEEALNNLKARGGFAPIMDLREAHLLLRESGQCIDVETKRVFVAVWIWMAKIMQAYGGKEGWRNLESAKEYVRTQLGRFSGETFLTELSPIPSRNGKDKTWVQWFKKLDPDLETRIKLRTKTLREMLKKYDPPLVVCYGSGNKLPNKFAELLDVEWQVVTRKLRRSRDSRRLLLPFLGTGQMSHAILHELLDRGLLRRAPGSH